MLAKCGYQNIRKHQSTSCKKLEGCRSAQILYILKRLYVLQNECLVANSRVGYSRERALQSDILIFSHSPDVDVFLAERKLYEYVFRIRMQKFRSKTTENELVLKMTGRIKTPEEMDTKTFVASDF